MAEVGLIVTADDKATKVLKKIGAEGQKSLKQIGDGAKSAKAQVSDLDKTFERFTATAVAGIAFGAAVRAVGDAFRYVKDNLIETLPTIEQLNGEFTETDARLASINQQLQGEGFDNLNFLSKSLVIAYSALNTELAKNEAAMIAIQKEAQERQRQQDAVNALIADEADATGVAVDMSARLLAIKQKAASVERTLTSERAARAAAERAALAEEEAAWLEHYQLLADLDAANDARIGAGLDAQASRRAYYREMQLQLDEDLARQQDAILEQQAQNREAVMASLVSTIGGGFEQIISDSDNAGKHMTKMLLDVAEKAILAHAAEAGSGAGAAVSAIPIVGPALMPAAIAAAFALVKAMLGNLPGFAFGGVVTGGTPNRDSVPALLTPGERVLTQRETREYERGGRSQGGSQTVNLTVVAPTQNPQEMTRAQMRRWVNSIAPFIEEAFNDRSLLKNARRA